MSDTNWITEGTQVAIYRPGINPWMSYSTVDRLTSTQILLANGGRFRRADGREVGYMHGAELLPLDDPAVRDIDANNRLNRLAGEVDRIVQRYGRGGVEGVVAALDEIERAVTMTRAAVRPATLTDVAVLDQRLRDALDQAFLT